MVEEVVVVVVEEMVVEIYLNQVGGSLMKGRQLAFSNGAQVCGEEWVLLIMGNGLWIYQW